MVLENMWISVYHRVFVNKAKGWISKLVLQESKAR